MTTPRALVVVAGLVLIAAPGCGDDADSAASKGSDQESAAEVDTYSGYTVDPRPDVSAVTLPTVEGTEVAMPAAPGGLRIVYFGYLSCPDVCPTTMADLRRALAALPEDERDRVEVAMVTIDPGRDTAQHLSDYVSAFVDDGVALHTADPARLRAAADAFGADYRVETNAEGVIEVSHTGELYAVDDKGLVVMQWPFGTTHESLTRDIRSLLRETDSGSDDA